MYGCTQFVCSGEDSTLCYFSSADGRDESYVYLFVIIVKGMKSPREMEEVNMQKPDCDSNVRRNQGDPFRTVRDFLYQVRDGHRAIVNIEKRISLRQEALKLDADDEISQMLLGEEMSRLEIELTNKKSAYAATMLNVSDIISQLTDINQQMVLTFRYIDMISDWYEIADRMGMTKPVVQKIHGRAIPRLQAILDRLTQTGAQV